ncbi:MAG: ABC transporter substrate-binding protein [Phycisphaeraceae bacterium]
MREHLPKIVIIALLVAIVGVPILLRPADGGANAPDDAPRLVVYTPHNEQIRHEIEHAYNDHRREQGLPEVVFDWRTPGGTSDIRKSILSQYNKLIDAGELETKGIGVDLFFGGGDYDHGKIADGVKTKDDDGNETAYRIVMDPQIDQALFDAVFPDEVIGGEKLVERKTFNENGQAVEVVAWTGVTLSSFGIVYNNDALKILGIDQPTTWSDLADPKLRGWVALADPGHSGSIAATFNTILKREGWTRGWMTLRMVYANARYFATSSDRVPVDVSRGDAAAGMCIDFYGRYQAGAVGKNRMGYADPIENGRSMTATTADPITLLRGAPSPDLARAFIAWLLTPEAQSLWQRAKSGADDGLTRPDKYELRRQPIRADLYTRDNRKSWVDQELDPFPTAVPFPPGTPDYFGMVAPVTRAMAIDVHEDLVLAWEALAEARENKHPNLAEMEQAFFALPEALTLTWPDAALEQHWQAIHSDPDHPRHSEVVAVLAGFAQQLKAIGDLDAKRVRWRAFFRDNYREVIRLGRE